MTRPTFGLRVPLLAACLWLALAPACKSGGSDDDAGSTLYDRLGGEPGIRAVVEDAVVNRIAADPRINAYFLNDDTDVVITINCLVKQLGNLSGGPELYPGPDCRDMKETHEGMGVSDQDFMDLAEHFVGALSDAGVAQDDIDIIVAALVDMKPDIVEDPSGDATIYQRVGRKPGLQTLVADLYTTVSTDPAIMGFFVDTDQTRFEACLTRQLCAIDGPCDYGGEATALDPSFGGTQCRDMLSAHEGLTIAAADFQAMVADFDMVLSNAGVVGADRDAILSVLGTTCADIIDDPSMCP